MATKLDTIDRGQYRVLPPLDYPYKLWWWIKRWCMFKPHMVIGNEQGGVYMSRWWITPSNPFANVYLHVYQSGDDAPFGYHDHPWNSISILLKGGLLELLRVQKTPPGKSLLTVPRRIGKINGKRGKRIIIRKATDIHYIGQVEPGTITLFLTGRKRKEWGFTDYEVDENGND